MNTLWLALALVLAPSGAGAMDEHEHQPTASPIVVDTDMALDDVRALLALLAEPRVDVRAVATVEGSASVGRGTDNLVGLLENIQRTDVEVLRGAQLPGQPAPFWRDRVERLGGAGFPPPRGRIEVGVASLGVMAALDRHPGALKYLALGPLSNLALLQEAQPWCLDRMESIWIPADIGPDLELDAWNLRFDRASTRDVFEADALLVLVDVSVGRQIDARALLQSVTSDSPAAAWIHRTLADESADAVHWQIYDELVAAAVADRGLVEHDVARYSLTTGQDGAYRLKPQDDGNVTVVRFKDVNATTNYLKQRWESPPLAVDRPTGAAVEPRDLMRAFHGHLGPYVVLGYRMGVEALEALGSEGHFDLTAQVHSPWTPPASCLIDGVQIGSGCTLGKGNIDVVEAEGPAVAVFTAADGRTVTVRLRDDVPQRIRTRVEHSGVEAAAEEFLGVAAESLFDVTVECGDAGDEG